MPSATRIVYSEAGAIEAADAEYRRNVTANDPVSLAAPLPATADNLGIQDVATHQNIAISPRFNNPGDSCDLYLVLWSIRDGTRVAVGIQEVISVSPTVIREGPTLPYVADTQFFDTSGAQFFEVRVANLSGVAHFKAWTF